MKDSVSVEAPDVVNSVDIEARPTSKARKDILGQPLEQIDVGQIKLDFEEIPLNWSKLKKWTATMTIASMSATSTFSSSIHASAVQSVSSTFECSEVVSTLGVSMFLIGFATGPLLFGPFSEAGGRSIVFRFALFFFFIFNIACALAPNIGALLIFRYFSGFFGSPGITNGASCIADIWPPNQRSVPFALFTTGGSLGPVLAPAVAGFVVQYLNWRWIYWIISILSGFLYIATWLFVPETYVTFLLLRKQKKAGFEPPRQSLKERYYTHLTRPWLMLFTEPILFTLSLYSSFLWGILYLDFTAYPVVFLLTRQWSPGMAGLSFLGIGVGLAFATASSPLINRIHTRYVEKLGGPKPEARLPHLIYLAWGIPVTMFWFGWSANPPTHWIVSIASGVPFGLCFLPLFLGTNAYLTDCYGKFSASALAAFSLMRNGFSAIFPLFAKRMYLNLGTPWATSLLGFITLAMAPVPWLFFKYGARLRSASKFHVWTVQLEEEEARQEQAPVAVAAQEGVGKR